MLNFWVKNKRQLTFWAVLLVAVLARAVLFPMMPGGLNQDEASIGYDSWSLLHYGVDRNGCTLPVHLLAWGSGQNVLYAYLSIPFIAIFGLNLFSVRIVSLLLSVLTVVVIFFTVKKFKGFRMGIIAMALTAISPWNIMLSRWGLESNIFPAMLTFSICALLYSFKKNRFMYLAGALFALTLYSYGSAYLVVTLFCVAAFIFILVKKLVPVKTCLITVLIYCVISAPIYAFMLINVLDLETVKIGLLTIPKTYGGRISAETGFSLTRMIQNIYENLILQTDGTARNSIPFYGCFYVISLPFWIYGIYKAIRDKGAFNFIALLSLACSLTLFLAYNISNINRINAVYIPMIYFTAYGVTKLSYRKGALVSIALVYAACFAGFNITYFGKDYTATINEEFNDSFGEAIIKADEISKANNNQTVNVASINMSYIYALFYTQTPTDEFLATVNYANPGGQFQVVSSYSNFNFNTAGLNSGAKGIYVINNDDLSLAGKYTNEIYAYSLYSVAVIR